MKPYTRYGPFLIGILTGIYLSTKKESLLKKKVRVSNLISLTLRLVEKPLSSVYILSHVFSGTRHSVGSVVCQSWLCWLDWPTFYGRPQPTRLPHMPSTRVCTDRCGHWLWPGSYWLVRKAMEVSQEGECSKFSFFLNVCKWSWEYLKPVKRQPYNTQIQIIRILESLPQFIILRRKNIQYVPCCSVCLCASVLFLSLQVVSTACCLWVSGFLSPTLVSPAIWLIPSLLSSTLACRRPRSTTLTSTL